MTNRIPELRCSNTYRFKDKTAATNAKIKVHGECYKYGHVTLHTKLIKSQTHMMQQPQTEISKSKTNKQTKWMNYTRVYCFSASDKSKNEFGY